MLLLHIYHYCFVEELELAKMQILPSLSCVKWGFGLRRPSREVCSEGVWWFIKPLAVCTQGNNSCCYVQYIYGNWVKRILIQILKCQENGTLKQKKCCKEFTSQRKCGPCRKWPRQDVTMAHACSQLWGGGEDFSALACKANNTEYYKPLIKQHALE